MTFYNPVVWYEGMFLQAQHFQQQDRYVEFLIQENIHRLVDEHWGFLTLKLNQSLLNIGKVAIEHATGFFSDGTYFNMPEKDSFPRPLALGISQKSVEIFLCLPLNFRVNRELISEDDRQRYKTIEKNVISLTDSDEQNIQFASLNLQLKSNEDDLSEYTCLSIGKVLRTQENSHIRIDERCVADFLDFHQSFFLINFLEEVCGLIRYRADSMSKQLVETKRSPVNAQLECTILSLLNKYEVIFYGLVKRNNKHPRVFYNYLIELISELSIYTQNNFRPRVCHEYFHNNLTETFQPVVSEVRYIFDNLLDESVKMVKFVCNQHGLWIASFKKTKLTSFHALILVVKTDGSLERLRESITNQVKLAPSHLMPDLIKHGLAGMSLQKLNSIPQAIPYHVNQMYFKIETDCDSSLETIESYGLALHVVNDLSDLGFELWAIKE